MQLINSVERWPGETRPVFLALGNFDGVHRGHRQILKTAAEKARAAAGVSAALIFDPHPSILLRPDRAFALLTDIADRAALIAGLGLDYLIVEPFTEELVSLTPEKFVTVILRNRLNVSGVVVGYDYSFGHRGMGRADTMQRWGEELGFDVAVCPPVQFNRKVVSSSAIRELLMNGAVREASELLNYYFFRRGRVIKGHGIGKKMVFPTANISVSPRLIWPGRGVYLTAVGGLSEKPLFGLTNVGDKPTFMQAQMSVETYILDFQGEIYNRELCLYFLEKLRETRAFSSAEELKAQIGRDIQEGRELIADLFSEFNVLAEPPGYRPATTG